MVPFRYEGIEPWGMAVPLASALLTLGFVVAFGVKLSIESLVIMFALGACRTFGVSPLFSTTVIF